MKLSKENVCVFIEDESHLKEARELLERCGEAIFQPVFHLSNKANPHKNYLYYNTIVRNHAWGLGLPTKRKQITLPELEEILKSEV